MNTQQMKLAAKRIGKALRGGDAEQLSWLRESGWSKEGHPTHQQILEILSQQQGCSSFHEFRRRFGDAIPVAIDRAAPATKSACIPQAFAAAVMEGVASLNLSEDGELTLAFGESLVEVSLSTQWIPRAAIKLLNYHHTVSERALRNCVEGHDETGRTAFMWSKYTAHRLSAKLKGRIVEEALGRALFYADIDEEVADLELETGVDVVRVRFCEDDEVKVMSLLRESFRASLQYCLEEAEAYAADVGRDLLAEDRARFLNWNN